MTGTLLTRRIRIAMAAMSSIVDRGGLPFGFRLAVRIYSAIPYIKIKVSTFNNDERVKDQGRDRLCVLYIVSSQQDQY